MFRSLSNLKYSTKKKELKISLNHFFDNPIHQNSNEFRNLGK